MVDPELEQCCRVLGVAVDATTVEIRQAYVDLVNVWHPDRFANNPRLQAKAAKKLTEVNRAYEILAAYHRFRPRPYQDTATPDRSSAGEPQPPNHSPRGRSTAVVADARFWLGLALAVFCVALWSSWDAGIAPAPAVPPESAGRQTLPVMDTPRGGVEQQSAAPPGVVQPRAPAEAPARSNEAVLDCQADPLWRPTSGTEVAPPSGSSGLGELSINNGTSNDAVVVLYEAPVQRRAVYVRAGETSVLRTIGAGTYVIRSVHGSCWVDLAGEFLEPAGYGEFERPFQFSEDSTSEGTKYARVQLTLHAVRGGNIKQKMVPPFTVQTGIGNAPSSR